LRVRRNRYRRPSGGLIGGGPADRSSLLEAETGSSHWQEQMMARRRSHKETYAQKVVGLATSTLPLPTPVQKVAKSRWGARILIVLVPVLIATGVITISWTGGLPSISVNKDRAAAVGREVKDEAIKAAERVRQYGESNYR
jgi:hypothetical protein